LLIFYKPQDAAEGNVQSYNHMYKYAFQLTAMSEIGMADFDTLRALKNFKTFHRRGAEKNKSMFVIT
jgi:hypothetical protein